jgi:CHASE3 domain sensor protein
MPGLFDFSGFLLIIFIVIIILLAIREIVMWYWKINEMNKSLHQQEEYLESILNEIRELNGKIK